MPDEFDFHRGFMDADRSSDSYWNPQNEQWEIHPPSDFELRDEGLPQIAGDNLDPYEQLREQYRSISTRAGPVFWDPRQRRYLRAYPRGAGGDASRANDRAARIRRLIQEIDRAQSDGVLSLHEKVQIEAILASHREGGH